MPEDSLAAIEGVEATAFGADPQPVTRAVGETGDALAVEARRVVGIAGEAGEGAGVALESVEAAPVLSSKTVMIESALRVSGRLGSCL
jgi:hypothetical protein